MPDAEIPVRFELSINGNHVATGGVEYGVLNLNMSRSARDPATHSTWTGKGDGFDDEDLYREEMNVVLGGIESDHFVRWVNDQGVQVGDELLVKVLGPGPVDPTVSREGREKTFAEIHKPASSDGTRETELRELEEYLDQAHLNLLAHLNAPIEEFKESIDRYEYAVNSMLGALVGASNEAEGKEAAVFYCKGEQLRATASDFRRHLLAHRRNQGLANAGLTGD